MSCRLRGLREKIESGINKRKGRRVKLRKPEDLSEDVWAETHEEGVILEDAYVIYRTRAYLWEVSIQAVAFKDGCVGLRIVHYKDERPMRALMTNYLWVLEDLKPEIGKTVIIKSLLEEAIATT